VVAVTVDVLEDSFLLSTSVFFVTTTFFALVFADAAGKEASSLGPAFVEDLVARPIINSSTTFQMCFVTNATCACYQTKKKYPK
jgi:hypothetical protein